MTIGSLEKSGNGEYILSYTVERPADLVSPIHLSLSPLSVPPLSISLASPSL